MSEFKIESTTPFFEKDPQVRESMESNIEIIKALLENKETELGEGNTADVHFLDSNSALCLKILKSPEEIARVPVFNRLEKEMGFLVELQNIDNKVKVPKPYLTADYEGTKFLLMETLQAHTVIEIVNGEGSLPENFNIEDFRSNLKNFLEKMHERNIYHRDLHAGNIMINPHNGEIYVIDFGASSRSFSEDDNPYAVNTRSGSLMLTSDEDYLNNVYQVLKKYLLTK